MDIDGIGESLIDQLVEAKLVSDVADLYDLDVKKVAALERWEKSAQNVVAASTALATPRSLLTGPASARGQVAAAAGEAARR
jgi:DNA ligase (NAD+)